MFYHNPICKPAATHAPRAVISVSFFEITLRFEMFACCYIMKAFFVTPPSTNIYVTLCYESALIHAITSSVLKRKEFMTALSMCPL